MRKKIDLEKFMEWVKGYKFYEHLSLEILATIPDDYIEQAVIDHIYRKFTDSETELDVASNMSLGLQMVYSTADYEAKLNDGGFRDYFLKTPLQLIEMTLSSLGLIGATEHYQLLQTARDIFVYEQDVSAAMNLAANETVETHPKPQQYKSFSECEETFDKLDLRKIVIDYIHKHPEEFVEKDNV